MVTSRNECTRRRRVVGAVTLLLGLLGLFRPEWTMNFLGYAVASNAPATFVRGEVRAVYGGLMVTRRSSTARRAGAAGQQEGAAAGDALVGRWRRPPVRCVRRRQPGPFGWLSVALVLGGGVPPLRLLVCPRVRRTGHPQEAARVEGLSRIRWRSNRVSSPRPLPVRPAASPRRLPMVHIEKRDAVTVILDRRRHETPSIRRPPTRWPKRFAPSTPTQTPGGRTVRQRRLRRRRRSVSTIECTATATARSGSRMTLGKPVIAAVSGYAVAGGLELAIWVRSTRRRGRCGLRCLLPPLGRATHRRRNDPPAAIDRLLCPRHDPHRKAGKGGRGARHGPRDRLVPTGQSRGRRRVGTRDRGDATRMHAQRSPVRVRPVRA